MSNLWLLGYLRTCPVFLYGPIGSEGLAGCLLLLLKWSVINDWRALLSFSLVIYFVYFVEYKNSGVRRIYYLSLLSAGSIFTSSPTYIY